MGHPRRPPGGALGGRIPDGCQHPATLMSAPPTFGTGGFARATHAGLPLRARIGLIPAGLPLRQFRTDQ
ncbi:hypothetical protein RA210_U20584 [Rubrivivax sp. A210]|nr:hypothetical protein RA210_U20584 [Rubrivivax sp. A210]